MDTSKIVGEKIKSLRESQSISMEELAQRSGLAIEQIERIENNIDLPSLAPLIKIARVLGVRLGTFLDDQDENGPVVCRKSEAKDSISFSNNAIHSRKHMEYHSLSKSKADRHMEPFIIDVAPTDDSDFVLSSHGRNHGNQLRQEHLPSRRRRQHLLRFHRTAPCTCLRRTGSQNTGSNLYTDLNS